MLPTSARKWIADDDPRLIRESTVTNALEGTERGKPGGRTGSLRSLLFVPADSERKVAKALDSAADLLILDLEDAVASSAKDAARELACAVLRSQPSMPVVVRVNSTDTPWYLPDVAAVGALGPRAIMLPKCRGALDVCRLGDQLAVIEAAFGLTEMAAILPLVTELAEALASMDYRDASERLLGLGFAGEDLAADLGVLARDDEGMNPLLTHARQAVAVAAAAAQVAAIDTPFPDPRDDAGLQREAAAANRMGFTGKMCIHPGQIEIVHAAFRPTDPQIDWAHSVVSAFAEAPGEGVTTLDGKMIDRAHLRLAERRLAQVEAA